MSSSETFDPLGEEKRHRRDWRFTWMAIAAVTAVVLFLALARGALAQGGVGSPPAQIDRKPITHCIDFAESSRAAVSIRIQHVLAEYETAQILIKSGWAQTVDWGTVIEFAESAYDGSLEIGDDGRTIWNFTDKAVPITIDGEETVVEPNGMVLVVEAGTEILCSATCGPDRRAICIVLEDGSCYLACVQCVADQPCDRTCIVFSDPGGLPGYP